MINRDSIHLLKSSGKPRPQQKIAEFEINRLEADQHNMTPCEPSRLNYFELIWITNGKAHLTVDHIELTIDGQLFVCLVPGQLRSLSVHTPLHGYCISIAPDFLGLSEGETEFSILRLKHFSGHNLISLLPNHDLAAEIKDIVEKMFKEYSSFLLLRSEILKSLLKLLIIYISRNIKIAERDVLPRRDVEIASRFMELLKKRYRTTKKVSDYADELCVSANYLNQMVKRVSGFPASYHIQQQIVLEAKRQAQYSGLRMKEIADRMGFDDYAHFSKFFKTYSGMSFSNFRSGLAR